MASSLSCQRNLTPIGERAIPRFARFFDHMVRTFRDIATLREVKLERPPDRATDLEGGAQAARGLGLNRLAERLEGADSLSDL